MKHLTLVASFNPPSAMASSMKLLSLIFLLALVSCGDDTRTESANNESRASDGGATDATFDTSDHNIGDMTSGMDAASNQDLGWADMGLVDAGAHNDTGVDDTDGGGTGGDDAGVGDAGSDDMGPTAIYRPTGTFQMAHVGDGLHQMRVMWGANGDILWSTGQAGLLKADGTTVPISTTNIVGGGVAMGYDGTRYHLAYTRNYTMGALRVLNPIVATADLQGSYTASERLSAVEPMTHMEMAWNGAQMMLVGGEIGQVKLFPLGATPNANPTVQKTTIPIYINAMFALVWDGARYCVAISQSNVNFACFLPDGTTTLAPTKIGETFTSMELDMVHAGGNYYVVFSNLASSPDFNYENFLVKVDGTGNTSTHVTGTTQLHDLFYNAQAVEHDGEHLLIASVEDRNVFLRVYDDSTFVVIEEYDLGPGLNVDLALSATELVVAHTNLGTAPSAHVGDTTFLKVFDRP